MKNYIARVLSLILLASPLIAQNNSVGDSPEYTFSEMPFNGRGTTSLADLRGKPVLIDFWGTL